MTRYRTPHEGLGSTKPTVLCCVDGIDSYGYESQGSLIEPGFSFEELLGGALMKAAGWIALVLVMAGTLGAWAQCNCGAPVDLNCYLKFKTNETIEFKLIAPVDYFAHYQTTVSPQIFGWRVEDAQGTVVRMEIFPSGPRSRLKVMEWDLTNTEGYSVEPGFYQIIVMTTVSDVSYQVFVEEACRSFCACACGCYTAPCCVSPCRPPFGELYLSLDTGETRPCNGLTFSITITLECEEETP